MISSQEMQGNWTTVRGKLKEKWGQLTDDDLQLASGNIDQLVGKIQRRTGEAKSKIETFLDEAMSEGGGMREKAEQAVHQVADRAREGYENVSEKVREGYDQVSGRVRDGYRRAENLVQEYPGSSIGGVFVCGVITGVCLGLMFSGNDRYR